MSPSAVESSIVGVDSAAMMTMLNSGSNDNCASRRVSMTIGDLARAADRSFVLHQQQQLPQQRHGELDSSQDDISTVRFNLRKRTVSDDRPGVVMSSYNSAFLSGLFADIAKATEDADNEDPRSDEDFSVKKSRLSMTRSISRCARSYANLASVSSEAPDFFDKLSTTARIQASPTKQSYENLPSRHNSLTYQLHCVSSASSDESDDLGRLAFPHLPATVSDPSCFTYNLTRTQSGRQTPATETSPKDSYGWFVEMEDDNDDQLADDILVHPYKASSGDLAFSAPTAPKGVNYDAELEWAKAADTVDDVLGDFF